MYPEEIAKFKHELISRLGTPELSNHEELLAEFAFMHGFELDDLSMTVWYARSLMFRGFDGYTPAMFYLTGALHGFRFL